MNHLKGPVSIILKDFKLQFYIFTAITALLVAIYTMIGYYISPENFHPFISGPIYGILLMLPFFMFGDAFKSTVGLGGTRTSYLTSLMMSNLLFIISLMIVHNVLFQLSEFITVKTESTTQIFHLASLFGATNAFTYFWVDILIGIFFVGTGTIVAAALYRFGYIWMLAIAISLSVILFLWITLGDISGVLKWTWENMFLSLHLLGGVGIVSLVLTYPLMKRVTLKM